MADAQLRFTRAVGVFVCRFTLRIKFELAIDILVLQGQMRPIRDTFSLQVKANVSELIFDLFLFDQEPAHAIATTIITFINSQF